MGVVGELALDLHAISRSSIDKSCLMHFLLARTSSDAQEAILDVLRRAIDEQESLPLSLTLTLPLPLTLPLALAGEPEPYP